MKELGLHGESLLTQRIGYCTVQIGTDRHFSDASGFVAFSALFRLKE
jgi:hypothetical protein